MKYQAFTNDSLAMMHHGARGALAVDDELFKLGEEPRFKVRATSDWAEHAADLEAEMMRRGMRFEAIDLSTPVERELVEPVPEGPEPVSTESGSAEPLSVEPVSVEPVVAEPDSTQSVSSESAPTVPALPVYVTPEPTSDAPKMSRTPGNADSAVDHDTRLRSRIAAVLKIRT
jgi:hypothetical protein